MNTNVNTPTANVETLANLDAVLPVESTVITPVAVETPAVVETVVAVDPAVIVAVPTDSVPAAVEIRKVSKVSKAKSAKNRKVKGEKAPKAPKSKRGPGRPRTKVTLRRVVLVDGKPVGKGRPVKASKGARTVVYVPVGQKYSKAKFGLGTKFSPKVQKLSMKRVDIEKYGNITGAVKNVASKATPVVADLTPAVEPVITAPTPETVATV